MHVQVRLARRDDLDELVRMWLELWPQGNRKEHSGEVQAILQGSWPGKMPVALFVAEEMGAEKLAGFAEAGLRSHADGCDPAVPVGYLEGWYVDAAYRNQGIGAKLVAASEEWARSHGCIEMASDTWIDSEVSQRAHEALGYEVVDRCVHYRKLLRQPA